MSTKCSIKYGNNNDIDFHLYEECFEDDHIYLNLSGNVNFDISKNEVTLCIPLVIWEQIRQGTHSILKSECAGKTDEQLMEMSKKFVQDRIERHKKNPNSIAAICGVGIFGSVTEPEEKQILNGLEKYKKIRDFVNEINKSAGIKQ